MDVISTTLRRTALLALAAIAVLTTTVTPAIAWEIDSTVTTRCHERITAEAMRRAGWPDGQTPPPPSEYEQRILDDVPFTIADDQQDGWHVSLLIGVRHNDIENANPTDLAELARIHNNPDKQPDHCIRRAVDDFEAGDASAIEACRAFILEQLSLALGPDGEPDVVTTVEVDTYLQVRGEIELDLQRFGFHLGKALHALQDSYTHQFRDPNDERIKHVLNWVEGNTGDDHDLARDGHPHLGTLDDCSLSSDSAERREQWATDASAALIAAISDGTGGRQARLDRASAVLDERFGQVAGCTVDNDWCDEADADPAAGCSVAGAGAGGWLGLLGLALVALVGRSRRRVAVATSVAVASFLVVTLASPAARAQDPDEVSDNKSDEQVERELETDEEIIESLPERVRRTWGLALSTGASIDRGGAMVSGGGRWNVSESIGLGLDVEYNPTVAFNDFDVSPGTLNVYVPVTWTHKRFGSWELRTTFYAGTSTLLTNLVAADKGTTGLFVGVNPLGLAIPLNETVKLIIKPGDIAVPIPQISGIPFYYHQYRATIGIEWYP